LRGFSDDGTPIYSTDSASGIIIGTGNVGFKVAKNSEKVNTFMSRDGGHSWYELRKGYSIHFFFLNMNTHTHFIKIFDFNKFLFVVTLRIFLINALSKDMTEMV
jgi:hypothetical protein